MAATSQKVEQVVAKEAPKLAADLAAEFKRRWDLAIDAAAPLAVASNQIRLRQGVGPVPSGGHSARVTLEAVGFQLARIIAEEDGQARVAS